MLFFYLDLNIDGSFILFGENKWGFCLWYVIDEIDEEIIIFEEDEDGVLKCKKKCVNVFMDGDEDVIDYNDDDLEDEDFIEEILSLEYDEENFDDEKLEVELYDFEINEIIFDEDLDEDVEINEEDDEEEEEEEEV